MKCDLCCQFPDELLKDSPRVAKALRSELGEGVRLFVMADAAYGSCCVDEIAASHVDAECVVHYGHACMSPTSTLPAMFVFGKASIDIKNCADLIGRCLSSTDKPILVFRYDADERRLLEDFSSQRRILKRRLRELLRRIERGVSVGRGVGSCQGGYGSRSYRRRVGRLGERRVVRVQGEEGKGAGGSMWKIRMREKGLGMLNAEG
ncbi:hypothetical protein BHE74_00025970 [Ensete ventricosum]|nr:hypothetical protein BHE74_00025970 [Ensete ventricosum]